MKLDADQSILNTLAAKEAENERLKKEKVELTQKLKRLEKEKKEEKSLALAVFESLLDCPVCSYPYIKTRIPMVGTCGHTLCGRCAPLLPNHHCPICRAVGSFRKPAKNFFASEFIDQHKLLKGSQARGNTILIVGGPNIDNEHKSAAVLNSHRTKWIPLDLKLPCQAYSSGVVYLNEEIYLIGGWKNFDALYKLDKKSLEWVQLADMNVGRQWINNSCVAWDGCIWVFGGVDESGKPLKSVERYDPKWNKWKQMPDMEHARSAAVTTLWKGRIIISGGVKDDEFLRTTSIVSFNPDSDHWTCILDIPTYVNGHALVSYKEDVVAMGGLQVTSENSEVSAKVRSLYPLRSYYSSWDPLPSMKNPATCFGGIVLDEEIYAIGGCQNGLRYLDRVEIFDGKKWRAGPSLPYPSCNMSTVIIPQYLADRLCTHMNK